MRKGSRRRGALTAWTLVVVSAMVAYVLGVVGFSEYYHDEPGSIDSNTLYYALRLFLLEWDLPEDATLNASLEWARWLAPASVSVAAISAIVTFADRWSRRVRLRFNRNHAIVCGLGRQGYRLVRELRAAGIKVVVIEVDTNNPHRAGAEAEDVFVVTGDATDRAVLAAAGAEKARYVFAVAGDDDVNVAVASAAQEIAQTLRSAPTTQCCAVHVEKTHTAELFSEQAAFSEGPDHFRVRFYNINRLAARVLIEQFPPDRFQQVHELSDRAASIVVVGNGHLAEEVVLQLARVGHYGNLTPPVVRLVAGTRPHGLQALKRRIEQADSLVFDDGEQRDLEVLLADDQLLSNDISKHDPSLIYVCLSSAVDSFRLVRALQRTGVTDYAKIVVCIGSTDDISYYNIPSENAVTLSAFDLWGEACTLENILREGLDSVARAIHEDYVDSLRRRGETAETNKSLQSWERLTETKREANRGQADHMSVKLRALGYDPPRIPVPDELVLSETQEERLAQMEHRRWMAERKLAGWRYTEGPRDDAKRRSPWLVPWEQLPPEEKEKDRRTSRDLARLWRIRAAFDGPWRRQ